MKAPRMFIWILIAIALAIAVFFTSRHQLPISLYKLHLATAAGVAAYFFDRVLAYYARPDAFLGEDGRPLPGCELAFYSSQQRRAIIIAAWVIGILVGA